MEEFEELKAVIKAQTAVIKMMAEELSLLNKAVVGCSLAIADIALYIAEEK